MGLTHLFVSLNHEQAISKDEMWDPRPTYNGLGQEYRVVQLISRTPLTELFKEPQWNLMEQSSEHSIS